MGEMRNAYTILLEYLKGGDDLEDQGVDGKITLKCILKNWDEMVCTGCIWVS
jgi:hypothetical protein